MSPFKGGQLVETLDFAISLPSKSFSSSKCSTLVKKKCLGLNMPAYASTSKCD
jgi:hypothetical protein